MENRIIRDMDLVNLIILVVLTFLSGGQGNAMQCFVCNSKSDPRCADPIQTEWQGSDQESESGDSNESNEYSSSLIPVECHLAVQYSAGIKAVSDLFRGFGHPRLGIPDLWISTSAALAPNQGSGSGSGSKYPLNGGGFNKGYAGNGYRGGSGSGSVLNTGSYGGHHRDQDESIGCHKVVYSDSNGDSVVDRGCAPSRVANLDPCSALDSATSSNDNPNGGNTGNSGSGSGYKNGYSNGDGGGGSGGNFDISQISPEFCEVCDDADGCNAAPNLRAVYVVFCICTWSMLSNFVKYM